MTLDREDIETILNEIIDFSLPIYYLISNNNINLCDVQNIFLKNDLDKATLSYQKVIGLIKPEDFKKANELYRSLTTKLDCIDRVIENKEHLKDIRDIALNLTLADEIINEKTYKCFLNITYLNKILDTILNNDNNPRTKRIIREYQKYLSKIQSDNDHLIDIDINNYYYKKVGA